MFNCKKILILVVFLMLNLKHCETSTELTKKMKREIEFEEDQLDYPKLSFYYKTKDGLLRRLEAFEANISILLYLNYQDRKKVYAYLKLDKSNPRWSRETIYLRAFEEMMLVKQLYLAKSWVWSHNFFSDDELYLEPHAIPRSSRNGQDMSEDYTRFCDKYTMEHFNSEYCQLLTLHIPAKDLVSIEVQGEEYLQKVGVPPLYKSMETKMFIKSHHIISNPQLEFMRKTLTYCNTGWNSWGEPSVYSNQWAEPKSGYFTITFDENTTRLGHDEIEGDCIMPNTTLITLLLKANSDNFYWSKAKISYTRPVKPLRSKQNNMVQSNSVMLFMPKWFEKLQETERLQIIKLIRRAKYELEDDKDTIVNDVIDTFYLPKSKAHEINEVVTNGEVKNMK